jgi:hypothetical protein
MLLVVDLAFALADPASAVGFAGLQRVNVNHLFAGEVSSLASLAAGTPPAKTWAKKRDLTSFGPVNRARFARADARCYW